MKVKKIYNKLLKNKYNISFVESMTGGALSFEFVKIPGASKVLSSSIVTYQIDQKIKLLTIPENFFETYNVVSRETAEIMADNFQQVTNSEVVVSVTGNAGPTFQEGSKNVVWICIKVLNQKHFYNIILNKGRVKNIKKTKNFVFKKLETLI